MVVRLRTFVLACSLVLAANAARAEPAAPAPQADAANKLSLADSWFERLRRWLWGEAAPATSSTDAAAAPKVTFTDVAGVDSAKAELAEVVAYLKDPANFADIGAYVPRGVLLSGPPGTGKTLLARAMANEANVAFFAASGSSFTFPLIGLGVQAVRQLFAEARAHAPAVVFIDEIDGVGRARGSAHDHAESERILNQLLVELDGFSPREAVVVVGATNRPEMLDEALVRAGRLERKIFVSLPDLRGRAAILAVHLRRAAHAGDIELLELARSSPGFSGADLASWVNEALLHALRAGRRAATMADFRQAWSRVVLGAATGHLMTPDELHVTAYHEAGHALVATLLPGADEVSQVSVVNRGRSLGATTLVPLEDVVLHARSSYEDKMAVAMGGRAAEVLVRGGITDGSSSDLQGATQLASNMVRELGMSEAVGPVFYGNARHGNQGISAATAERIDAEVAALLRGAERRATDLLTTKEGALHALAAALVRYETLSGDEVRLLAAGGELVRPELSAPQVAMDGRLLPSTAPPVRLPEEVATAAGE